MAMLHATKPKEKKAADKFFVDEKVFPQTLDVLKTRSIPVGIELVVAPLSELDLTDPSLYGVLLQYPNADGEVIDYRHLVASAKEHQVFTAFAADLLSLTLLTPPGEMGADVVVGTSQRLGIPMGYGGPHAGYFATKESLNRHPIGRGPV